MGSTKIKCKDLAFLIAMFIAAISPAPAQCLAQHNSDSFSADSSDLPNLEIAIVDEVPNRLDLPFDGTAEDKRRMDEFAAQITDCVILFRRFGRPFLVRLYVAIGIIFMLRAIVKKMATDS